MHVEIYQISIYKTYIVTYRATNGPCFIKPSSPFNDWWMRDYDGILEWRPTAFTNGDGIKTTQGGWRGGIWLYRLRWRGHVAGGGRGRGERLPGSGGFLSPCPRAKWTPIETKTQKMTQSGAAHREGGGKQGRWREPWRSKYQGTTVTRVQDKGGKGGANGRRIRWQTQACGTGRRDEWQRLADGGCGERPGGRRSVTGKEVGRGCDREVLRRRPPLMGDGSREHKIKRPRKRQRQVGRGDRIRCHH